MKFKLKRKKVQDEEDIINIEETEQETENMDLSDDDDTNEDIENSENIESNENDKSSENNEIDENDETEENNENDKSKPNKKKVSKKFIVLILVVFIAAFVAGFLFISNKNNNKKSSQTVDEYSINMDSVESITAFSINSKDCKLKEIVPFQEDSINKIQYIYKNDKNSEEIIELYSNFLQNEREFVPLEVTEYEVEEGTELLSFAKPSSVEDKMFRIDIKKAQKNYSIIISRPENTIPKPEKEEKEENVFSRDSALTEFKDIMSEKNILPNDIESYTQIFDIGQTIINGEECYGITVYEEGDSGYNDYVNKFFISLKSKSVYVYSTETGETTKLN